MLNYMSDRERQILCDVTYMWNLKKLNIESRMLVTRVDGGGGRGGNRDVLVQTQTSSYKMNKLGDLKLQHGDYS